MFVLISYSKNLVLRIFIKALTFKKKFGIFENKDKLNNFGKYIFIDWSFYTIKNEMKYYNYYKYGKSELFQLWTETT